MKQKHIPKASATDTVQAMFVPVVLMGFSIYVKLRDYNQTLISKA